MDALENRPLQPPAQPPVEPKPFENDVTLIAFGVKTSQNENIETKAKEIVDEGLGMDPNLVVRAVRTPGRNNKPGLVKMEMVDLNAKVEALRRKRNLDNYERHGKIFIGAAKSHTERLIELNFRALLKQIPTGSQLRVAGNGRLIPRAAPPAPGDQ